MEYSDDIVERVRAALMDYHAATAANGCKRTWSSIASALHQGFLVPPLIDEDDDNDFRDPDKPLSEALRRFAAGAQTPSKERLDALALYLTEKSYLSESDLKPAAPDSPLIRALLGFFSESADPATPRSFTIRGSFSASRKNSSGRTELAVLTIRDGDKGVAAVEDKLFSLPIPPQSIKRDALARILKRTGGAELRFDGWLFQSQGQVCLFVRDSLRNNPSVYTVLESKSRAASSPANLSLLKSRDFGIRAPGYKALMYIPKDADVTEMAFSRIRENIWLYREEAASDAD
jgi:hypothetical protein